MQLQLHASQEGHQVTSIQALTRIPPSSSFIRIWMKIHGQCTSSLSMRLHIRFFLCIDNKQEKNKRQKINTMKMNYCLIVHAQMVTSAQLVDNSQAPQQAHKYVRPAAQNCLAPVAGTLFSAQPISYPRDFLLYPIKGTQLGSKIEFIRCLSSRLCVHLFLSPDI
jgi:hypothetical protein